MTVQQWKDFQRLVHKELKPDFFCPLCGEVTEKRPADREDVACQCGASWRAQSCMLAILEGLGYPPNIDPREIQTDFSRLGLGISDDFLLARRISNLFSYTNSFYHRFPILDVMNPPDSATNFFEFVSCSDVLEHTPLRHQARWPGYLGL